MYSSEAEFIDPEFPESVMFNIYYTIEIKPLNSIDVKIHEAQWFDIEDLPLDQILDVDKDFIKKNLQK